MILTQVIDLREKQLTKNSVIDYILKHYTKISNEQTQDEYYINNEQKNDINKLFSKYHIQADYEEIVKRIFQPTQTIQQVKAEIIPPIAYALSE